MAKSTEGQPPPEQRIETALQEVRKGGVAHNPVANAWLTGPVGSPVVMTDAQVSATAQPTEPPASTQAAPATPPPKSE